MLLKRTRSHLCIDPYLYIGVQKYSSALLISMHCCDRCVPVVPENLTAAQVMGFPRNGTAYLLASHFIASPAGLLGDAVGELAQNWRVILAFTACGLLVGLVWLVLLRFAAVCFIMGLMLLLQTGLVGVTLLAWDKTQHTQLFASIPGVTSALASISLSGSVAHTVAILLSVITLVTFLLLLVMASRILVAVRLIQEAARAVSDMKSILLVPLSNVPLLLALALWVGSGSLLLASAGDFDSVLGAYSYGVSSVLTVIDARIELACNLARVSALACVLSATNEAESDNERAARKQVCRARAGCQSNGRSHHGRRARVGRAGRGGAQR